MGPGRHILASSILGAGLGAAYGSPIPALAAFAAGVGIDADHFLDYALNRQGRFRIRRFLSVCGEYRLKRFYLIGHSLEWIIPFLVFALLAQGPAWLKAAGLGLGLHMAMDLAGNGIRPEGYFLLYRLRVGFDPRRLLYRLPAGGLAYWGSFAAYLRGRPQKPTRAGLPGKRRV